MTKLFYPYLLADYPSPSRFPELFQMTLGYASAIELGVPFSDPIADGPIIQKATSTVLARGFQIETLLKFLQSQTLSIPVALMSYANPILAFGRAEFMKACVQCGVRSLIVPDVPFEEAAQWREEANQENLSWISFVSLQTREERLQRIAAAAEGFLYLISVTGITGSRITNPEAVKKKGIEIRKFTTVPIALGFGIQSRNDVLPYLEFVDAFIVGSRIVELITKQNGLREVEAFYKEFCKALTGETGEK
jgi:tryptophan synthase alpha chain